ncbi:MULTISPECIES: hypothetical protein [Microbulbifer]|uniref:hypothetical protein n=1 Tax=Microbulbifer TaxID=48073 RepID=UPI001B7F8961|nr:hypothetical protein [Microbulbifer variabilis]
MPQRLNLALSLARSIEESLSAKPTAGDISKHKDNAAFIEVERLAFLITGTLIFFIKLITPDSPITFHSQTNSCQ